MNLECINVANNGALLYGIFKSDKIVQVLDRETESYLLVINDHIKPDGKVDIYYLLADAQFGSVYSAILPNSIYKCRMKIADSPRFNEASAITIYNSIDTAFDRLTYKLDKLRNIEVDVSKTQAIIDELFPLIRVDGEVLDNKSNENIMNQQDTYRNCLDNDALDDVRNTGYQMYMAMIDYTQHHFKSSSSAYDINKKMTILPGFGSSIDAEGAKVSKLLKLLK